MINLKPIDWDNFWHVIKLSPKKSQLAYLQPVSVFLAQSYINLQLDYPDISLALYDDDLLIGFTKIVFVPKSVEPYNLEEDAYLIDAIIVDQAYQGKGYGKAGLNAVLEYIKTRPFKDAHQVMVVCYDDNHIANQLFNQFGFIKYKPYNINKGMTIYRKPL